MMNEVSSYSIERCIDVCRVVCYIVIRLDN